MFLRVIIFWLITTTSILPLHTDSSSYPVPNFLGDTCRVNHFWREKFDRASFFLSRAKKGNDPSTRLVNISPAADYTQRCSEFDRLKRTRCLALGLSHRPSADWRRERANRSSLSNGDRPSSLLHGRRVRAEPLCRGAGLGMR